MKYFNFSLNNNEIFCDVMPYHIVYRNIRYDSIDNEYIANDPEIGKLRKQVNYFLAESPFEDIALGSSGGLDDASWFKLSDIIELNFYDDILPIITKAINIFGLTDNDVEQIILNII